MATSQSSDEDGGLGPALLLGGLGVALGRRSRGRELREERELNYQLAQDVVTAQVERDLALDQRDLARREVFALTPQRDLARREVSELAQRLEISDGEKAELRVQVEALQEQLRDEPETRDNE